MSDKIIDNTQIKDVFETWKTSLNGHAAEYGTEAREDALDRFQQIGFPGRKKESWKYTNLTKILAHGFEPATEHSIGEVTVEAFESMKLSDTEAIRVVYVDGKMSRALSELRDVDGLSISSSREATPLPENDLTKDEALIHLNTVFSTDGVEILIDDRAVIDLPIEIYNITTCPGQTMIQPRHHIRAGKGAEALIVETYYNLCVGHSFTNCVNSIVVDEEAKLDYVKIEHPRRPNSYLVDHTIAEQAARSRFRMFTFTLSGDMVRNNVYVKLSGEQAEAHLLGLYVLEDEQHADNRTIVDHAVPNCFSNELYKGILDGKSTGVFNGKIIVRQDAQQTNAYQNNRNILVSDDATINTQPQLEIYADDVKCSHGATSAQIADSELFYLRSRGIGKAKARALLMLAFAGEVWQDVRSEPVRAYIERQVSHAIGIETE